MPTTLWGSPSIEATKRTAEAVGGERAGHPFGFAGGHIGRDLVVVQVGEADARWWPPPTPHRARAQADHVVPGVQVPAVSAHPSASRPTASCAVAGLPNGFPSSSSSESQPTTR